VDLYIFGLMQATLPFKQYWGRRPMRPEALASLSFNSLSRASYLALTQNLPCLSHYEIHTIYSSEIP
jgi:hypothetical protein